HRAACRVDYSAACVCLNTTHTTAILLNSTTRRQFVACFHANVPICPIIGISSRALLSFDVFRGSPFLSAVRSTLKFGSWMLDLPAATRNSPKRAIFIAHSLRRFAKDNSHGYLPENISRPVEKRPSF